MAEQSLDFTHHRIKPTTKLACFCILATLLLIADNRLSIVGQLKNTLRNALYPVQWVANQPIVWYDSLSLYATDQIKLKKQNQALQQQNLLLQNAANDRNNLLLELNELKLLSDIKTKKHQNGVMAEVIAIGQDPLAGKLFINKGSNAQLQLGQAVIDQQGLIGQIISIQKYTAEISVATHAQSVIPVMNTRTGVRTLLYGNVQNLELRYMPTDADLKSGDLLVTSGLDDVYPAGIPVAQVTSAKKSVGSPYYKADTKPVANIDKVNYVLALPLAPRSLIKPTDENEINE